MLCCLSCCIFVMSYCVFDIFGCYAACHVTHLDVMLISYCVFDIFGCYAACHVVYLTCYLDVMT